MKRVFRTRTDERPPRPTEPARNAASRARRACRPAERGNARSRASEFPGGWSSTTPRNLRVKDGWLFVTRHCEEWLMDADRNEPRTVARRTAPQHPRRLRDLLRLAITDRQGITAPGSLPSEHALMDEFAASRTSVRRALSVLADEGHIERRRGQGTSPVESHRVYDMAIPARESFDAFRRRAAGIMPRILHRQWVPAPGPIASRLSGTDAGDPCLAIEYVLVDRNAPVAVITNYLRAPEAECVTALPFVTDFYSFLFDAGVDIADQATTLQARPADAEVAPLLEVPEGAAVLGVEQEIRNSRGDVIDVALGVIRGDVRVTSSNFLYE